MQLLRLHPIKDQHKTANTVTSNSTNSVSSRGSDDYDDLLLLKVLKMIAKSDKIIIIQSVRKVDLSESRIVHFQ